MTRAMKPLGGHSGAYVVDLANGEVLFEGSPEEILANPEVRRVYLGDRFS